MSSNGKNSDEAIDYAPLYEDALLRCRQANDDDNGNLLRSLQCRVQQLAVLEQAVQHAAATNMQERDAVQALLEHHAFEASPINAAQATWIDENLLPSSSSSAPLPLPRVLASYVPDADAFFAQFPQAVRSDVYAPATVQPLTKQRATHEASVQTMPTVHRKKKPPTAPTSHVPSLAPHDGNFSCTPVDLTGNDQEEGQIMPTVSAPPPTDLVRRETPPCWDNNISRTAPADPPLQHARDNPFQTAREWAPHEKNQQNSAPQQQQQQQTGYNPYLRQNVSQPPPAPPPPPPQPAVEIRDSLKRKFIPPKRTADSDRTTASSSSVMVKPGGGGAVRSSTESGDTNPDDELPPELQRLGKELVDKITSEIMDHGDPISFADIAGRHDAKQTIQEVIIWPMKRPDLFIGLRRAPNAILVFGPPGTGKTLIAKAISHESGATFFSISSSSLTSKWIGEGEKLVRTLFAVAAFKEPSVVFIDEIDSLLTQRKSDENEASRRIKTEFLVQLDGTGTSGQGRVLVIGATNRPQELDDAARRRFVKRLYVPLPSVQDRETLLRILLATNQHVLQDKEIRKLAHDYTSGFSGADLQALCTDAAMGPIRELGPAALEVDVNAVPPICYKHFRQSLRGIKASVAPSDLVQYEEWDKVYGSSSGKRDDETALDDDMEDDAVDGTPNDE